MPLWPAIHGETPIDPSDLRDKSIKTRDQLNVVEAENIRKAVVEYLSARPTRRKAPFDCPWCLRLHREMFGDVWTWAGKLRTKNLNLGIPFGAIPESLAMLLADLASWSEYKMEMVEQASRLHHRSVQIHPFENGNGRWARMLANIWLKLHGNPLILWPDATIGGTSVVRDEYLEAIKTADGGDYAQLIALHERYVEQWPD